MRALPDILFCRDLAEDLVAAGDRSDEDLAADGLDAAAPAAASWEHSWLSCLASAPVVPSVFR